MNPETCTFSRLERCITISFILALAGMMASCSHPNRQLIEKAPLISRNFNDSFGRTMVLSKTPSRVVSLASSITEIIYAIGAEGRLCGVSHDSDHPEEAGKLPYVATYPEFDLPAVVGLTPDLVLASTEIHDTRIAGFFDKYKIHLYFQDYRKLEDVFQSIRELGQMLERPSAADGLADSLETMSRQIADSTASQVKYNTVVLLGIDPITVVGSKSFLNDLLSKAGAKNPFETLSEKYPVITPEQFIQAAPEYVLVPSRNDRIWNDLVGKYPEIYTGIPAAQQGHVFQMDPGLILRPGPRIVEGLAHVTRILHPRVNLPL
jgi:iron complex transport system substrate-binding protein